MRSSTTRREALRRQLADAEQLAHVGGWRLDLGSGEARWSDQMYRFHGLEPGEVEPSLELVLEHVHPDDEERIRELLEAIVERPASIPAEGVTAEYRIRRRDATVREIRFHGRVELEGGRPVRWVGSAQDITEQRLVERELRAHDALNQALAEWRSFDEDGVDLLRRLATALEFPMAAIWARDPADGRLRARAFWRARGEHGAHFEAVARASSFGPGEGVVGAVWESRRPKVVPDLPDALTARRGAAARQTGVRSGIALPALGADGPLAVLSFYSLDRRDHSDRLARTLQGLGAELGRFLDARRAELEPPRLSTREVEVLKLAAEGLSGPEIAARLGVRPATVKTHFENLYDKLGVGDRAAAVAQALRSGLFR